MPAHVAVHRPFMHWPLLPSSVWHEVEAGS